METVKENRRFGRSVVALLTGFIAIVALSLGTDQLMHVLGVYPPWGEPMNETGDNLLALGYRTIYAIFGSYLVARLAPHHPMKHALISGAIGFVLSLLGVFAAMQMNLGPMWYPVALVITALPCAWIGGLLHGRRGSR